MKKTKYYAGIGSRNIPDDITKLMEQAAYWLAFDGFILRSGGADGSDSAFQKGVEQYNQDKNWGLFDNMEIYLPYPQFNDNQFPFIPIPDQAFQIAYDYHPYNLKNEMTKKLMARNSCQVLGKDLATPSNFVLCWTKNGCRTNQQRLEEVKDTGGTGQAISIADHYQIPVYNLKIPEHRQRIEQYIDNRQKLYLKMDYNNKKSPNNS